MLFETKIGRVVIKGMLLLEFVRKRKGEGRRSCNSEQVLFASCHFSCKVNLGSSAFSIHYKEKQGFLKICLAFHSNRDTRMHFFAQKKNHDRKIVM